MTLDKAPEQPLPPALCEKCKKPTMKRSNFRTGSVDKPKADVGVCTSCGHRVELT